MSRITFWKHTAAMLFQDVFSNHLRCLQDDGMSHRSPKRRPQRGDRSNIPWPLSCNRARDHTSQAVSDQMNLVPGFLERLLNGFIQLLPNQEIRALRVEADS